MNAAKYREVLEENLLQSIHWLRLGRRFTLQHDIDLKNKTKLEQLRDKSLTVFEWPCQSQDLNPREHLWRDLKMAVHRRESVRGSARKNGINFLNPGVQSL